MQAAPKLVVQRGRQYSPIPREVQMSPPLAEKILERNTLNRPLKKGHTEKLSRDMKNGKWKMNGETIKITDDGQLLDGQHRLWAVIESKATVPMLVVEGLPADVMPTIDTGRMRSFGDVLTIEGKKNVSTASSALRWLYWYRQKPRGSTPGHAGATHSELHDLLEANEDFLDRASEVASADKARRIVTQSVLCFVYAMAYRADPAKAGAWLGLLNTGEGLDAKHPVLLLRERLMANRMATAKLPLIDVAALTIKSWNNFITGKRPTVLRWSNQEQFPEIATSSGR